MNNNGQEVNWDVQPVVEEPPRKLTVFIVDNQPLFRQAIRNALAQDMEIVGESALTTSIWSVV